MECKYEHCPMIGKLPCAEHTILLKTIKEDMHEVREYLKEQNGRMREHGEDIAGLKVKVAIYSTIAGSGGIIAAVVGLMLR